MAFIQRMVVIAIVCAFFAPMLEASVSLLTGFWDGIGIFYQIRVRVRRELTVKFLLKICFKLS